MIREDTKDAIGKTNFLHNFLLSMNVFKIDFTRIIQQIKILEKGFISCKINNLIIWELLKSSSRVRVTFSKTRYYNYLRNEIREKNGWEITNECEPIMIAPWEAEFTEPI